jgi:iron complex transport system substrate-binding protein
MKSILKYFFFFLIFVSCKQQTNVIQSDENRNLVKYSKHFQIIKHENYTLLYILNPDLNKIEKKYALSKDFSTIKLEKDIIPIKTPISSIICLAGTDIGMLEKLNLSSKIKGVMDIKYVHSKIVKENFKNNKVKSIQDLSQINPESLIGTTSLITYSGFGQKLNNEVKFNKLGINCLPIYDWRELEALGKAEWIKLYGLLFNKEVEANEYFSKIENEYLLLKKSAKKFKKNTTIFSGSMIGDSWYMPAGESFIANMLNDANAIYVNQKSKGTGSSAYTFEKVFKEYKNTKIWINPGFKSYRELVQSNSKYQYFDAFKTGNVYCYSHNSNYFWEMGAIEPQKVLSDMIQIVHQDELKKKKLYFYKKINE